MLPRYSKPTHHETDSFFLVILFQTALFSQSETVSGTYQLNFEGSYGIYNETLTLYSDSSFEFLSYKKFDGMHPLESYTHGKGTWELKKNIVYFTTTESDLDSKHTLDLNNTEARFSTKSPRAKSSRETPTTLRVFKSDAEWLVGRNLVKE